MRFNLKIVFLIFATFSCKEQSVNSGIPLVPPIAKKSESVNNKPAEQASPDVITPVAGIPPVDKEIPSSSQSNDKSSDLFRFNLPEPLQAQKKSSLSIWGTYYYFVEFVAKKSGSFPVRNKNEAIISSGLTKKEWCDAALQGSFSIIDESARRNTYSFSSRSQTNLIDCSEFISAPVAEKIKGNRFELVNVPFGRGSKVPQVVPYRTLAVDPGVIAYGTIVYIASARGQKVKLPNGTEATHDGYFYAGDAGSAIHGNHVDFFIGPVKQSPFNFVQSNERSTVQIYLVDSNEALQEMKRIHGLN